MLPSSILTLVERARARIERVRRSDGGFILLESMIAIALITVIMGAIGAEYVSGIANTTHARLQTAAVQIAGSNMDQIRALAPSDLTTGRGSTAVETERATIALFAPNLVGGTGLRSFDATAAASSAGTTFATTAVTSTIGTTTYSIYRYFECTSTPTTSGSCVTPASAASLTSNNIRAVVLVTWPQNSCPSVTTASTRGATCSYGTSSIINADDDLTFDYNQPLPAAPRIATPTALTVAVGDTANYAMTVTDSTGVAPFSWAVTSGTLPTGLTMNTSGVISGVVNAQAVNTTSTITVTDAFLRTASSTITWTLEPALALSSPDQSALIGTAISAVTLTATGGGGSNYQFSDPSTSLPPGLTLSSAGIISGTPARDSTVAYPKTYRVSVQVTDPQSCPVCGAARTTTALFNWTINYPPLAESVPGSQAWTISTPLSAAASTTVQMTVTGGDGGPYVWSATGLPSGVVIDQNSGLITGTPTSAGSGSASITVANPTAGVASSTVPMSWRVYAAPSITTPGPQTNALGGSRSVTVNATCSNGPCTYTASGLPNGMAINSTTGVISGTIAANAVTSTTAVVTATDAAGATVSSGKFTWTILAAPTIGALGTQNYTETVTHSVPVSYSCTTSSCTITLAGTMPGLGLLTTSTGTNPQTSLTVSKGSGTVYVGGTVSTSAVTGSATSAQYTPTATITTSDNSSVGSTRTTWTAFVVPALTTPGDLTSSNNATINLPATVSCANASCTYSLSGGPSGLSVSSSTGTISGVVTSAANATPINTTLTAVDADGVSTSVTFRWTIVGATNNLSTFYNNVGVTADSNTNPGNFDGVGYSYSAGLLATGSPTALVAGSTANYNGLQFTWPATAGTGQPDNVLSNGQTVTLRGSGSTLGFLVGSANGSASGTGTITYTDGTTSAYTLGASDWLAGPTTNAISVTAARNTQGNKQVAASMKIYYVGVPVTAGKTVQSVKLPTVTNNPAAVSLHVFSMSLTSSTLATSNNNVGVTADNATANGNLDGNGNSLSATALANAGARAGQPVTTSGTTFTWPSAAGTGSVDNTLAYGQYVDVTGATSGTSLGFLVTAIASTTGTGTIFYTDGTQQSFSLTSPAVNSTSPAAITTSYVNASGNRQVTYTANVFYASAPLAAGKSVDYVQLPVTTASPGTSMHVFSIGVK